MQQDPPKISPIKAIYDLARKTKIKAEYQLEKESGPAHAKIYTILLSFGDKQYTGEGRSIKLAQRAAAETALEDQKSLLPTDNPKTILESPQSPTVVLNTWATQNHISTRYICLNEQYLSSSTNRSQTLFIYRLFIGQDLQFDGHGTSRHRARINCACHALTFIQQNQMFPMLILSTETPTKSQISLMYERAKQLGLAVQIEHTDPLTVTYRIGNEYSTTGTGPTKQTAKEDAARQMLEILPEPSEKSTGKSNRKNKNQHRKFIEQKGSNNYSQAEHINPITRLYQIGQARNEKIEFSEIKHPENDNRFHFQVVFGENHFAYGSDKNKQAAKRLAAENLLLKLNIHSIDATKMPLPPPPKKGLLKREENSGKEKKHVHFIEEDILSKKQQLIQACQELDIQIEYEDRLIDDKYESILSLKKDEQLVAKFRGLATLVNDAQEKASVTAWKNLKDLFNQSNK